jgi:hypothetical protein
VKFLHVTPPLAVEDQRQATVAVTAKVVPLCPALATFAQSGPHTSLRILCPIFGRIEPGTLPGDATTCTMVETASRALLLRRLAEAVNEH